MVENLLLRVWSALSWKRLTPGAQTERRGDAGPVRGLLGGKDLTGRLVWFQVFQLVASLSVADREVSEHIIVAGGCVIAEKVRDRERVEADASTGFEVESTADARASASAGPSRAAGGPVVGNDASAHLEA